MSKLLVKAKSDTLRETAKRWAALRRKEQDVEKVRKDLGKMLMSMMLSAGVKSIDVGGGHNVQWMTSKSKKLTKTLILATFGKEQGEQFWKGLEDDVSEYLSLTNCETKKE